MTPLLTPPLQQLMSGQGGCRWAAVPIALSAAAEAEDETLMLPAG